MRRGLGLAPACGGTDQRPSDGCWPCQRGREGSEGAGAAAHAAAALAFFGSLRPAPEAGGWVCFGTAAGGGGAAGSSSLSLSLCLPLPLPFAAFFFLDLRLFPDPAAASSGSTWSSERTQQN